MKLHCRFIIYCLLLFFQIKTWGQYGTTPQIINFSKTEYNASSQNWAIDQDSIGNIFVANNKGLLVFNGAWSLYELPGQQIVRSVACDNNGRIYTGGFGEFGYWQKEFLGNYIYHSLTKNIRYKQFSKEEIWKIKKIGDKIYFQSFSTIYVLEKDKITPIPCPGNIMYAFSIHNHIYLQVLEKGLYELNGKSFTAITNEPLFRKDEIISLLEDKNNHCTIIGTVHNGLYKLDNSVIKPYPNEINTVLKTAQVNAMIRLTDSTFAIGTIKEGVYFLHDDGRVMEHFDQQNGLQNNTILSLKKDLAGNLWVGMDRGLDQIVLQSPLRFFKDVNGDIGSVYAAALYNGDFYIGSNDGLYRYNPLKGFQNVGGINWQVWSLDVIDGQLFCAHNCGVTIIDHDKMTEIPNMPGGWSIKRLRSNKDYALQGTYIGLSVYKKSLDGHFHYLTNIKGIETMPISNWVEDENGSIWLKHAYKGMSKIRLNADFDSVTQIISLNDKNGIESDIQQNLGYWSDNLYTISTDGIKIWNNQNNSFQIAKSLFGIPINGKQKIKRVFPMPNNHFWMVKDDNQLIYVDEKLQNTLFFLKEFSLVGGYENIISLDNNEYVLCGESGFALFSVNHLKALRSAPPRISSVFVNDKDEFLPIIKLAKKSDLNWVIDYPNRSVKIVVANSVFDRMVQYRFKLSKYGEIGYWSEWQSETTKVYPDLSSGDYKIEVQTNLASTPTYFEFTILPPWYWTWWSKVVYIGIGLVLIGLFYNGIEKKHIRKLHQKQLEMEKQLALQKIQHENELLLIKKEKLEEEVQLKSEDLANSANELIKRKKLLNKLHVEIAKQKEDKESSTHISASMKRVSKELERQLKLEKEETRLFEEGFNTVHETFVNKLLEKYPKLTAQDLRLAAYLRMNLGSKEIAPLLNITVRSVELKRYRLRRKMELGEDINLNEFMIKI